MMDFYFLLVLCICLSSGHFGSYSNSEIYPIDFQQCCSSLGSLTSLSFFEEKEIQ